MVKYVVPYEESLKMKELGFDAPCLFAYNEDAKNKLMTAPQLHSYSINTGRNSDFSIINKVTAPLFTQAFEWIMSKNLAHWVFKHDDKNFGYIIYDNNGEVKKTQIESVSNFEKVQLNCLIELIDIVKYK